MTQLGQRFLYFTYFELVAYEYAYLCLHEQFQNCCYRSLSRLGNSELLQLPLFLLMQLFWKGCGDNYLWTSL